MARETINSLPGDTKLDLILANAISLIDSGQEVDIESLALEYPEYADELRQFFSFPDDLKNMLSIDYSLTSSVLRPAGSTKQEEANRSTVSLDDATIGFIHDDLRETSVPLKIGKYEIRDILGQGGFGRVYLAEDPLLHKQVAIKIPTGGSGMSSSARKAFLHEAQTVSKLRHPNIAWLCDTFEFDGGKIALVYEFVNGPTLAEVIKEECYTQPSAVRWIASLADALHHAHTNGIVHRDVKPSNVILDAKDGTMQPRLIDFGLATLDDKFYQNDEGRAVGTVLYMSPEQACGNSNWASAQSDIFSLGTMLYELVCGRPPFRGSTNSEVRRQIEQRHPPTLSSLNASVPESLERICLKALEKDPAKRYRNAAEMAADLRATLEPTPVAPAPYATPVTLQTDSAKRSTTWALLSVIAATALLAVGLVLNNGENGGSAVPEDEHEPPVPQEMELIQPRLTLELKRGNAPSGVVPFSQESDSAEVGDGFRITTGTDAKCYLYVLWYRPNHPVELLSHTTGESLSKDHKAMQFPSVGKNFLWTEFDENDIGAHCLVSFTKSLPLTDADLQRLKRANWQTKNNRVSEGIEYFTLGCPSAEGDGSISRGIDTPTPILDVKADTYMGQVGTILREELNCYHQMVIFQVHEEGHRADAF